MKIKIKLSEGAIMPKMQTQGSAGYDLYAHLSHPVKIAPGALEKIPVGLALGLPENMEAQIRPRSGLTAKKIDTRFGTIDSDYRGPIEVVLHNNSDKAFVVENGMRIGQMIFNLVPQTELETVTELEASDRGSGGWGSTGLF